MLKRTHLMHTTRRTQPTDGHHQPPPPPSPPSPPQSVRESPGSLPFHIAEHYDCHYNDRSTAVAAAMCWVPNVIKTHTNPHTHNAWLFFQICAACAYNKHTRSVLRLSECGEHAQRGGWWGGGLVERFCRTPSRQYNLMNAVITAHHWRPSPTTSMRWRARARFCWHPFRQSSPRARARTAYSIGPGNVFGLWRGGGTSHFYRVRMSLHACNEQFYFITAS